MEPQMNNTTEETQATPTVAPAPENVEPASDVSEYRTHAILGYILPFLFFLPLLDEKTKNVSYVRFHANQQLVLLLTAVASHFLLGALSVLPMRLEDLLLQIVNLGLLALMVIGVINAYKGEVKELPVIGQIKLLK
jgi:uncharacterized membrane protein